MSPPGHAAAAVAAAAAARNDIGGAAYKSRKEAFVSNLYGSSMTEITVVTLVASAAVLLWTALQRRQSFFTPYTPQALVVDFLLNVCGVLFAITLYSQTPVALSVFLTAPALLLLLLGSDSRARSTEKSKKSKSTKAASRVDNDKYDKSSKSSSSTPTPTPRRPFLTHYRGSMLVVTCLAILAVDFPIFPRRFAKVETWGTSLMDLGVGSFVFSAGVVSARTLVKATTGGGGGANTSLFVRLSKALRHSLPLAVLGLVRLYSVKGLDYAEHVTEYGVHWNFFFTLALLPPFVELADTVVGQQQQRQQPKFSFWPSRYDMLAVALAVTYEVVLDNTDLLRYIIAAPRVDLLSKNREGVFSLVGYLAIFLAARGTGTVVMRDNADSLGSAPDRNSVRAERRLVIRKLLVQSLLYSALFFPSTHLHLLNLGVSRRLANLPYVLWVVAFNNAQMLLFAAVEDVGPATDPDETSMTSPSKNATSRILAAFNGNGLVVFLVANLLTGLVNLTVNTLDTPPLAAVAVLVAYAAALTAFALILDKAGLKIKI